ncbi:RNA-directed DNA polymerase, eukaryota, reverse transcriptase zinc-binding domain protein, partial [Tanacetum coccineum]
MRRSLKTQDNLRAWDVGPNVDLSMLRCPLCDTQRDSHEHLFFECVYSAKVWDYVRVLADLDNVPPTLMDIVATLQAMGKARTARSI